MPTPVSQAAASPSFRERSGATVGLGRRGMNWRGVGVSWGDQEKGPHPSDPGRPAAVPGRPDHHMPHLPPTTASRASLLPLRATQAGGEVHPRVSLPTHKPVTGVSAVLCPVGDSGQGSHGSHRGSHRATHSRLGGPTRKAPARVLGDPAWLSNLFEHQSPLLENRIWPLTHL